MLTENQSKNNMDTIPVICSVEIQNQIGQGENILYLSNDATTSFKESAQNVPTIMSVHNEDSTYAHYWNERSNLDVRLSRRPLPSLPAKSILIDEDVLFMKSVLSKDQLDMIDLTGDYPLSVELVEVCPEDGLESRTVASMNKVQTQAQCIAHLEATLVKQAEMYNAQLVHTSLIHESTAAAQKLAAVSQAQAVSQELQQSRQQAAEAVRERAAEMALAQHAAAVAAAACMKRAEVEDENQLILDELIEYKVRIIMQLFRLMNSFFIHSGNMFNRGL